MVIHKDDYFLLRWLTYDIARTLGIPLFIEPVDGILCPLNGPEFVIVKNGLSAVFNAYGKQLTDFVKGHFKWKWAPVNPLYGYQHDRIIYNKEANIQLHTAWPMFQDE